MGRSKTRTKMVSKGVRYKLLLAFALMSVIPLLVSTYLASVYIFPNSATIVDVGVLVILSTMIAFLGFSIANHIIDPIITMALDTREIASGEYHRKIDVARDDELGQLGQSINLITEKIKFNIDELRNYGQRTREINVEIHKKVIGLSNLLQIGDIISARTVELDRILELTIEKIATTFESGYGVLYMQKGESEDFVARVVYNVHGEKLAGLILRKDGSGMLDKALLNRSMIVIDDAVKASREVAAFRQEENVINLVAVPIVSGGKELALLVVGNRASGFKFKGDDIDLVKVFSKQMGIAIENETLLRRTKELSIKDDLTGLFNKSYILTRLEEEIKRAIFFQRPCSFVIFNIDNFNSIRSREGELGGEDVIKKVAKIIREHVPPVAKIARIGGDEFAILIPETNKREATNIAEVIRKAVAEARIVGDGRVTVSAGVSENPIDGATRDEICRTAADALKVAKAAGKDRTSA